MSKALRVLQGEFGRVALLDMNRPLVKHAHHHCHILFKSSGEAASFNVNGTHSPLTDASAVLINAWEPHCYNHIPYAPPTEILAFYLEPTWLARIDKIFAASNDRHFFANPCVNLDRKTRNMVTQLTQEMAYGALTDASEVQQRIFELTVAVAHRFSNWRGIGQVRSPSRLIFDHRIRRSISHMREHTMHPLRADTLAKVAGLSRPRFFQLFKACTGLTPNLYGSTLLVEGAIRQLISSQQTISDVAIDLGFSEQSNFSRFFSQHVGCSPGDYRRKVDLYSGMDKDGGNISVN